MCRNCGVSRNWKITHCAASGLCVIYIPALRQGRTGTGGWADRPRAGKGLRNSPWQRRGAPVKYFLAPNAGKAGGGKPRGPSPQAGTLRTGYWTDGITLNYQFSQWSQRRQGAYALSAPDLQFLFLLYVKIAGWIPSRSSSTESLILAQDERWRRA